MAKHRALGIAAITLATLHLGCGANDPTDPASTAPGFRSSSTPTSGALRTQNAAPSLIVVTSPPADGGTISGTPPLTVTFNLCRSGDPDSGDSLNWQFHFGDSGKAAFNDDGTFNRDADHVCRVEHTYKEGTYTAWVSVTDKHLEDQSRGVSSLARSSQSFTIRAERPPEPPAPPPPVTTPALPYCHTLPSWCPGQKQFCEAVPIDYTNSSHARDACETCLGVACTDTSFNGNAWIANNYAFFYSGAPNVISCPAQYIWNHAPGDIASPTLSAGTNCGQGKW